MYLSQQPLLKRLSFLYQIAFPPLLKISWAYLCGSVSQFSILFYLCICHSANPTQSWLFQVAQCHSSPPWLSRGLTKFTAACFSLGSKRVDRAKDQNLWPGWWVGAFSLTKPDYANWERCPLYLMCRHQPRQSRKMKTRQPTMFQTKEQDKSPEIDPHEMELYDLPDREFITAVIK